MVAKDALPQHHTTRLPSIEVLEGLIRSEEHTSELQSRRNLVCRLLLEKKNTYIGTADSVSSALRSSSTLSQLLFTISLTASS